MTALERFKAVKNNTLRKKLLLKYDPEYCRLLCGPGNFAADDHTALSNGFSWVKTTEGHDYWAALFNLTVRLSTLDLAWVHFTGKKDWLPEEQAVQNRIESLEKQVKQLKSAIRKTIKQNRHLADGDNCTLIELKKVLRKTKGQP